MCIRDRTYAATLIPNNIFMIRFLEDVVFKYTNIIVAIFSSFIILILANIKYKFVNRKNNLINNEIKDMPSENLYENRNT